MTTPFSMLDKTANYVKDVIGTNPNELIQHLLATRECIMRNCPSDQYSRLSPIDMTVEILLEGFLSVFIKDQEYKNREPVFVRDVATQLVTALIQHYNEKDDIRDKYVDCLMDTYNHFKNR
jgi:hypothetical protein